MNQRTGALINGALIAIGTLGVVDNIIVHWVLQLHRAVPGRDALGVELALVAVSACLSARFPSSHTADSYWMGCASQGHAPEARK